IYPRGAMVCSDEVDYSLRQEVFLSHLNTLVNMGYNDLCRLLRGQFRMRVGIGLLVFDKKQRVEHFADIVIERASPNQQWIYTDLINRRLRQVGYLERVLEGSRSFEWYLTQETRVAIGQLH